jgi:hypothetical protein
MLDHAAASERTMDMVGFELGQGDGKTEVSVYDDSLPHRRRDR